MTVSTEINHEEYVGNGITYVFPYRFRIFKASNMAVVSVDVNGVEKNLVLNTDFTLSGVGAYTGGNVTLTNPLPSGWGLTLTRELKAIQETDLRNQGTFFAETHEDAFDYLTMLIQQVGSWFTLALRKPTFLSNFYDAKQNRIVNLADPVGIQDAVNNRSMQNYVEKMLAGVVGGFGWFLQTGVGAVFRTFQNKMRDTVSVLDYIPENLKDAAQSGSLDVSDYIQASFNSGRNVYIPAGSYRYSRLLYPGHDGQKIYGDGQENTIFINDVNNEPLFCFGNPSDPEGSKQWCTVRDISFSGNANGTTLWGVYSPNAPLVNGSPNISGQYEGISTSVNNFYFGRTSFALSDWTIAARGNSLIDVGVFNVKGGYALHVSAWDFYASKVRLWSGRKGLRNSGAANSNNFSDLYISAMTFEGIIEPDITNSIPVACGYDNCIVQQCGKGEISGHASIELHKGQGSVFNNLYLERNNERGGTTDIYIGVAAIGNAIDGVRHRVDTGTTLPVIVENHGQGTVIENIVYASDVTNVVLNAGTDPRTSCVIGLLISAGGVATTEVNDTSTGKRVLFRDMTGRFVSLGSYLDVAISTTTGLRISQGSSSSRKLELASNGNMRFNIDAPNTGTGRTFIFGHNGTDGTETGLVEINDSAYVYPTVANTGLVGTATKPFSGGFVQSAFTVTSDEEEKTRPIALDEAILDAWEEVDFLQYQYIDRVITKGDDGARWHFGLIAQRAEEAFIRYGLDAGRFGFFCKNSKDEMQEIRDEDGNIIQEYSPACTKRGIRYEEALVLEAACTRRKQSRLEARIEALEKAV